MSLVGDMAVAGLLQLRLSISTLTCFIDRQASHLSVGIACSEKIGERRQVEPFRGCGE
jgi:hypothetical protein